MSDEASAIALAQMIYARQRQQPLLIVSTDKDSMRPLVDVTAIHHAVSPMVTVALLSTSEAAWALTNALPAGMQVFGGALRLWMPGALPDDPKIRHRLYFPRDPAHPGDDHGERVWRGLRSDLSAAGIYVPEVELRSAGGVAPDSAGVGLDAIEPKAAAAGRLDQDAGESSQRSPSAPERADEAETLRGEVERANAASAAAHRENGDLRRQVRSLSDQVAALNQRLSGSGVFSDPVRQFEHEVYLEWLATTDEDARARQRLRAYALGDDFLASLANLDGIDRSRIVAACVDAIAARAWTLPNRAAHQHRTSASPGAPVHVREDGAAAWRCAIQRHSPSARRLMWWERSDGSVELAKVGVHDDFTIR